jgi:oligopeptide/dipeptide ABC transporter ATP-binding protein
MTPADNSGLPAVLEVSQLRTAVRTPGGIGYAVDEADLSVRRGEIVGLVGESGSGKTLLARSIMRVLPPSVTITAGSIRIVGEEVTSKSDREMEAIRGRHIAYVPQDASVSLNPVYRVDAQIREVLNPRGRAEREVANRRVIELLREVHIPDPVRRARAYPHQLSGGMRQRVASSIALAGGPELLIADEPTTALDVTVQAAYLTTLRQIQAANGMAILFITHDLALARSICNRIAVMYAGHIVEVGPTEAVFETPVHPYTAGLISCIPADHLDARRGELLPDIPGKAPSLQDRRSGCSFYDRCTARLDPRCETERPPLREVGPYHWAATFCIPPGPDERRS